ncbi:alpha/beta hydrolase [Kitasatospora sp. NPDC001660]
MDHLVPHTSSIPANNGTRVELFVREYDGTEPNHPRKPVLMLHGRSVPALAGFDLTLDPAGGSGGPDTRYSWALALADHGFDVFVMDLQGSGRSPRPTMDDPCNANPAQQEGILVPNPLDGKCPQPPPYPHQLGNSNSEWAELDTVVQFIKQLRSPVEKVSLVGWSAASFVMGPYTLQHPEHVESLLLLAPIFPPNGRWSEDPSDPFALPPGATLPMSNPATAFGYPMNLTSRTGFQAQWDSEQASPQQREPGMVDAVWKAIMDNDDIGRKWGGTQPGMPEGVLRYRNSFWWGWNSATAPHGETLGKAVPVLIVYGDLDRQANTPLELGPVLHFSVSDLYDAIRGENTLMFRVAGAGHSMVWERTAKVLHHISREWLDKHEVYDVTSGSYFIDIDGVLTPL